MRWAGRAAMLVLGLGLASGARAAPVDVTFEAVVRAIYVSVDPSQPVWDDVADDLEELGVTVGAPVQGSLLYDDEAAPLSQGVWDGTSVEFAFQVAELSASSIPGGANVLNAYPWLDGLTLLQLGGGLVIPLPGELVSGSLVLMGLGLEDWVTGPLPSAVPELGELTPFDLAAYLDDDLLTYSTAFGFGFRRCVSELQCQTVTILGEITALENVPEPATSVLVLGALGLLLAGARGRARA